MSNNLRFNSVEDLPDAVLERNRERLIALKFARPEAPVLAKDKPNVTRLPDRAKRDYKQEFLLGLKAVGLPEPEREVRFHPERKWRLDYCFRDRNKRIVLAVEYEGQQFDANKSAHQSHTAFSSNVEKYNSAALAGICLLRITWRDVKSGKAIEWTTTAYRNLFDE